MTTRVKFGWLNPGDRFWWKGSQFQKINDYQAKTVRNDKTTERKIEFAENITVEIE